MGLSVAYELTKNGYKPEIIEADDRLGGMAASFEFANQRIERYYHFHCTGDFAYKNLLKELGLEKQLNWKKTKMGFFFNGKLYEWGSVFSVLKFPAISFFSRLRYLLHALRCLTINDWKHLDKIKATKWLKKWLGKKSYRILWEKLFEYKFFNYSDDISAAWIWSRIKRLGKSRHLLKETLGYINGGSEKFIQAIETRIRHSGGIIHLNSKVKSITPRKKGGGTIDFGKGEIFYDEIISTIPLPLITKFLRTVESRKIFIYLI